MERPATEAVNRRKLILKTEHEIFFDPFIFNNGGNTLVGYFFDVFGV